MADNVALPASSGTVATDERSIGGSTVHVQRVVDQGGSTIANGQVTVDTTSGGVTIAAARDTRKTILVRNIGTVAAYIGTGTVTTSNGFLVNPGEALGLATTAAVKGITASSSTTACFVEEYDS